MFWLSVEDAYASFEKFIPVGRAFPVFGHRITTIGITTLRLRLATGR